MKILITENQLLNFLSEQSSMSSDNAIIILSNKKYFGLPTDTTKITPEYTKKMNLELNKRNVKDSERTLLGSLGSFIPVYETGLDIKSIVEGLIEGDKSKFNTGILGLTSPLVGKALFNLFDYFSDKMVGKEVTDYNITKRDELVNMSEREKMELFRRYGYGGYDKWVKDGKPKLK